MEKTTVQSVTFFCCGVLEMSFNCQRNEEKIVFNYICLSLTERTSISPNGHGLDMTAVSLGAIFVISVTMSATSIFICVCRCASLMSCDAIHQC